MTSIRYVHTDFRVEIGLVQSADDLLDALDRAIPVDKQLALRVYLSFLHLNCSEASASSSPAPKEFPRYRSRTEWQNLHLEVTTDKELTSHLD